jgi:hypothetical protein
MNLHCVIYQHIGTYYWTVYNILKGEILLKMTC